MISGNKTNCTNNFTNNLLFIKIIIDKMKYKILENPNYEETYELIEEGLRKKATPYCFLHAVELAMKAVH